MSKYIWINPVAEKMYDDELDLIKYNLTKKGYIIVNCESQLEYVKEQYKKYSEEINGTILDCRCPESINFLKRNNLTYGFEIPMIEPILVRTSRVLYEKYIKNEEDTLIITCPCTQLRDFSRQAMNDKVGIKFFTWKEFIENEGMESLGSVDESPIPLGYFKDTFENVLVLSSEEEILTGISSLKECNEKRYDIVEMLYCKNGCNNGDGL